MIHKKLTKENKEEVAKEASEVLQKNNAAIFPTDTLYALGVNAVSDSAVNRFFTLKKRPAQKPVPVFVNDTAMAEEVAYIDSRQKNILEKLWPGPYTFVLEKKKTINDRLSAGTDTIGLRIPENEFAQLLLKYLDAPVTGSSANISGMDPSRDPEKIINQFREYSVTPAYFADAGVLPEAEPSSVIDISGSEPKIIRVNQTTIKKLQEILDI